MDTWKRTCSLIERQEFCLARMNEPRTSAKREARNCRAAIKDYCEYAAKAGYQQPNINQQVRDIWDTFNLRRNAE